MEVSITDHTSKKHIFKEKTLDVSYSIIERSFLLSEGSALHIVKTVQKQSQVELNTIKILMPKK